ncbi:MAG: hypothetical protein ACFFB5_00145 [Promethearchaeota archaeon]
MKTKSITPKYINVLLLLGILIISFVSEYYYTAFTKQIDQTRDNYNNIHRSHEDIRLMSFSSSVNTVFTSSKIKCSSCSLTEDNIFDEKNNSISFPSVPDNLKPPTFKISAQYDVNITDYYPKAMEINRSRMTILLNFTITDAPWLSSPDEAIQNLTLKRTGEPNFYRITNDSYLDWTPMSSARYSLLFELNNTVLSQLELGDYKLHIYTSVSGTNSNDSVLLPMVDLKVSFVGAPEPQQFNNKIDGNQSFNITISVYENTQSVSYLPQNPNVTIFNTQLGVSGQLIFKEFLGDNSTPGQWLFTVLMTATLASKFIDGLHNLSVSITSPRGITDYGLIDYFEARGTVLLVILDEIAVGSYPARKHEELTNDSQDEVIFRLNVGDTLTISYYVFNNVTQLNESSLQEIGFQDPNQPENIFAVLSDTSEADGTGTLTLNATTAGGRYDLLIYVKGHQSSQMENPSKVVIYWDQLLYDYTYEDGVDTGTKSDPEPKALGVDIHENWSLTLSVLYESDRSPAKGAQISYRFGENLWENITDGTSWDINSDGKFFLFYSHHLPEPVSFECRIISGSPIDPQGYLFVNKTAESASFNLTIIWTYLIIEMIPSDARVGIGKEVDMNFNAYWKHDYSNFNGYIIAKDFESGIQKYINMEDGDGSWLGLVKTGSDSYRYYIVRIEDASFGITKFTNVIDDKPDDRIVFVDIVWDDIVFTFSDSYDPEKNVTSQDWGTRLFFANFGQNATLYCYAYHTYDNAPFNGTASLHDFTKQESHLLEFTAGIAPWEGNRTEAYRAVRFRVLKINSDPSFGIFSIANSDSNDVRILWDRIIITLVANQKHPHGSWANISVSLEYKVLKSIPVDIKEFVDFEIPIDPSKIRFDISLNGSIYTNISWTEFSIFSLKTAYQYIEVISMTDLATGLTQFEQWYQWLDIPDAEPKEDWLEIFWIDDQQPRIMELFTYELGNGTILIIIDVTDDSETWIGSGIESVELFDARSSVQQYFPRPPTYYQLPSGGSRYIYTYSYDQSIEEWVGNEDFFQFDFNDTLLFQVNVTDTGTNFDKVSQSIQKFHSKIISFNITANYDPFKPQFIEQEGKKINVTYLTIYNSKDPTKIREGNMSITVVARDSTWSGLNENSVQLVITDRNNVTQIINMELIGVLENKRDELRFSWQGNLTVFEMYHFTVIVTDNAGNTKSYSVEEEIEDCVAPRIHQITYEITVDRKIRITVKVEEAGLGVDYIILKIGSQSINLTQIGGTGAQLISSITTYSAVISSKIEFDNIIGSKSYGISIIAVDKVGNVGDYNPQELKDIWKVDSDFELPPLIINPFVILAIGIVLVVMIIVGIRITSKTVGYDMKKILDESEKISREVILTQMDEFALGVTVNFFDQIQGPVPVIWEPPLLEDQEQIMLDLSDKSFSTLEFVRLEEAERSGTFDFSTGSYECTALGYSFAVPNPEARGGKENLTIVLLLRKEWGDYLLVFQDELLEKLREIRKMVESQQSSSQIEKNARQLREFVSRLMISFNKLYTGIDYESDSMVE